MRREQFTLEVTDVAWIEEEGEPALPTLAITLDGDETDPLERVRESGSDESAGNEVDVTVRLYGGAEDPTANAVVSVTDRVTGEYLIEVDVDATEILTFVKAARRYGERTEDTARYRVRVVSADGQPVFSDEKRTLLVYSSDGELLRGHSLIPSGVEI